MADTHQERLTSSDTLCGRKEPMRSTGLGSYSRDWSIVIHYPSSANPRYPISCAEYLVSTEPCSLGYLGTCGIRTGAYPTLHAIHLHSSREPLSTTRISGRLQRRLSPRSSYHHGQGASRQPKWRHTRPVAPLKIPKCNLAAATSLWQKIAEIVRHICACRPLSRGPKAFPDSPVNSYHKLTAG